MSTGGSSEPPEMTRDEMAALFDRAWKAFNERDWETFFATAAPGAVVRTDPRWPGGGEFGSREEMMRFADQFLEPWEELVYERRCDPEILDGALVCKGSWVGRGRATGIDGRIDFTTVTRFRDGLIWRTDYFIDHDAAVAFAQTGERRG